MHPQHEKQQQNQTQQTKNKKKKKKKLKPGQLPEDAEPWVCRLCERAGLKVEIPRAFHTDEHVTSLMQKHLNGSRHLANKALLAKRVDKSRRPLQRALDSTGVFAAPSELQRQATERTIGERKPKVIRLCADRDVRGALLAFEGIWHLADTVLWNAVLVMLRQERMFGLLGKYVRVWALTTGPAVVHTSCIPRAYLVHNSCIIVLLTRAKGTLSRCGRAG